MNKRAIGALLLLLGCSSYATDSLIDIHGSISQTYLQTTGNDMFFKGSKDGSFDISDISVNISKQLLPEVRVGAQMLCRDFGPDGNFQPELDWGYGDYAFREELGFRIGKIRMPLGLYNEYWDIDSGRNEILLPLGVYTTDYRTVVNSFQGLNLYGDLFDEFRYGTLSYSLYFGEKSVQNDVTSIKKFFAPLNISDTTIHSQEIYGLQAFWNFPQDLKLGYSHLHYHGSIDLESSNLMGALGTASLQDAINAEIEYHFVSAEYSLRQWVFSAEYSRMYYDFSYNNNFHALAQGVGATFPRSYNVSLVKSWYIATSYQFDNHVAAFVGYGSSYNGLLDKSSSTNHRKGIKAGCRYDFSRNVLGKLEVHNLSGSYGTIARPGSSPKGNWWIFATRVTFKF